MESHLVCATALRIRLCGWSESCANCVFVTALLGSSSIYPTCALTLAWGLVWDRAVCGTAWCCTADSCCAEMRTSRIAALKTHSVKRTIRFRYCPAASCVTSVLLPQEGGRKCG